MPRRTAKRPIIMVMERRDPSPLCAGLDASQACGAELNCIKL